MNTSAPCLRRSLRKNQQKTAEWKNTPDLYNDYIRTEEATWAMTLILNKYGVMFDDEFFYWLVKGGQIIKRRPLYWYPQKSTPTEKRKRFTKGHQTKL